jgi:hypothetical protein
VIERRTTIGKALLFFFQRSIDCVFAAGTLMAVLRVLLLSLFS